MQERQGRLAGPFAVIPKKKDGLYTVSENVDQTEETFQLPAAHHDIALQLSNSKKQRPICWCGPRVYPVDYVSSSGETLGGYEVHRCVSPAGPTLNLIGLVTVCHPLRTSVRILECRNPADLVHEHRSRGLESVTIR